jgi:hypothetical protein
LHEKRRFSKSHCHILALLASQSYRGDLRADVFSTHVKDVLSFLSYQGCLTWLFCSAVSSRLSYPTCPVPAVLSQLSYHSCLFTAALSWLSCPSCPAPATLFLTLLTLSSCLCCHVLTWCSDFLSVLSRLACRGSPVTMTLRLSCPSGPLPDILSQLSRHGYSIPVVLSSDPCWHLLASCPLFPVLSVLSWPSAPVVQTRLSCLSCLFLAAVLPRHSCPRLLCLWAVLSLLSCSHLLSYLISSRCPRSSILAIQYRFGCPAWCPGLDV